MQNQYPFKREYNTIQLKLIKQVLCVFKIINYDERITFLTTSKHFITNAPYAFITKLNMSCEVTINLCRHS